MTTIVNDDLLTLIMIKIIFVTRVSIFQSI